MTSLYPIDTQLSQQIVTLPGAPGGSLKCYLSFVNEPTAGAVTVEYRLSGGVDWLPLSHASSVDATQQVIEFRIDGPVANLRVTLDGVETEGNATLIVDRSVLPVDAFSGLAAVTTQPYTEANVKQGLQFYIRVAYSADDPIAGGQARKIHFETGDKPVIVKLRIFEYVGEELQIELFDGPSGVTGGTDITPSNWNRINPQPGTVTVTKDVATTDDGTPLDAEPEYFFGSTSGFNRQAASIPQGRERVLPSNSSYIIAITNNNGQNARCQYFLDWYEGTPDLPL